LTAIPIFPQRPWVSFARQILKNTAVAWEKKPPFRCAFLPTAKEPHRKGKRIRKDSFAKAKEQAKPLKRQPAHPVPRPAALSPPRAKRPGQSQTIGSLFWGFHDFSISK
jgi:hypothetical protein